MPDPLKMIRAAHEAKEHFDEMLLRANVQDSGEARVSATLCLTISEQFAATLHLVEGGFSTHAPVVVRSMLEGLASLLNLTEDPNYLDQMRFESARADITLCEEYAADPDMKPQGVIEQFRQAGMLQNYIAYLVFCSFSHNQLTTLISLHAGNFELRYHHEAPAETTASTLTVALSVLCRTIDTLPKFTDIMAVEVTRAIGDVDAAWILARS